MKTNTASCIFFLFLFIVACNSPKNLAREFLHKQELPFILFISNPKIFTEFYRPQHYSSKLDYYKPEKIMYLLEDSMLTELMAHYAQSFTENIKNIGFNVFTTDDIHLFFETSSQKWQLQLVQVTFEEHRIFFQDQISLSENTVCFDTIISEYQMNVWFELSPVNADSTIPMQILFASLSIADIINGKFVYNQLSGNFNYQYNFTPVIQEDIITMVMKASFIHAHYLFDYFLNRYIFFRLTEQSKPFKTYFTYDHNRKKIVPAQINRFIFM